MKKIFSFILFTLSVLSATGQNKQVNRSYLGVYGYYDIPLFGFSEHNYKPGGGASAVYLSKKIHNTDSNKLSLRIGVTAGISGQGTRKFTINQGTQRFSNTYYNVDFLGRITLEEKKVFKPYVEGFFGLGNFSSRNQFTLLESVPADPSLQSKEVYSTTLLNFGLSAGYVIRLTEGFMIDAKVTYTQCASKVPFIDLDNYSYYDNVYHYQSQKAVPSLLTVQLGFIFWTPKFQVGPSYYSNEYPSPATPSGGYQQPTQPSKRESHYSTPAPNSENHPTVPRGRGRKHLN